jgi:hypothetical protein
MAYVPNRSAFVLIPEQPMLDWVRAVNDKDLEMEDLFGEAEVYLVPPFEEDEKMDAVMETHWMRFWDIELTAWCRDQSKWPQKRSFEQFQKWFKFTPFNGVHDLGVEPIKVEKD